MSEDQYEGGQADSRMVLENDERPSVFRPKYRKLDGDELELMNAVKAKAQELWDVIDVAYEARGARLIASGEVPAPRVELPPGPPNCRSLSIARTKLEESVMWAVKGLTA